MNVIDTELEGIKIIEPRIFGDARGYFFESWNEQKYKDAGIDCNWVQDNESRSSAGVVRGLHYQLAPYTQAKLVRVIEGAVRDVVLDIRRGSPTFGRHVAVELSGENRKQLFVPRGFAHGFAVLTEHVVFAYKCDNFYTPSHERGIAFDDPALGIDWGVKEYLVSEKDRKNPLFSEAELFSFDRKDYLQ